MSLVRITRNAIAGLMIAAVPVTAATAAVRPGSAIPAAGSTAAAAQDGYNDGLSSGWIALVAVAIIWAIALLGDDDDNDDLEISRA